MNLFLWTARVSKAHIALFEDLRRSGFALVEIPASDYSAAEIATLNRALDELELRRSMATLLGAEHNPISADATVRARALGKLIQDIDQCAALGADTLIGPMHSAHKVFTGSGPTADEFARCAEVLRAAGEYAARQGVSLSVEFLNRFECYFLNSCAQASALVHAVGLPNVGVLYDTHHANIEEGDVYSAIREHAEHINHVHISESHRGTPGTGTVQWQQTFAALRDSGYDSRLVIEAFGTAVPEVAQAVNVWRDCFTSPESVYRQGFDLINAGMAPTE